MMIRHHVLIPALAICLLGASARAVVAANVYLGTATGGVAIYYNSTGGENIANIAYMRAQASITNTNGAVFNFDPNLFGASGYGSGHLFQAVPDQFGLDLIVELPSSDNSVPTPTFTAYDNVDGNVANAAPAGNVGWALSTYIGPTDGPANPLNQVINSLARGDTGFLTVNNLTQVGTVFTVELEGLLTTDGYLHWHSPSIPDTQFAGIPLMGQIATGNLVFSGTLSYDSSLDTTPGLDFYTGSIDVYLEVVPIPEPSTLVLAGCGAISLVMFGIRRQRRRAA